MKRFWRGFYKKGEAPVNFKKHIVVLYWSPEREKSSGMRDNFKKLSVRYPSVKAKVINVKKDPLRPIRAKVREFPTVLLLKNGREVDRVGAETGNHTLLEQLFRKAHV